MGCLPASTINLEYAPEAKALLVNWTVPDQCIVGFELTFFAREGDAPAVLVKRHRVSADKRSEIAGIVAGMVGKSVDCCIRIKCCDCSESVMLCSVPVVIPVD
jgi:hypothetical protein